MDDEPVFADQVCNVIFCVGMLIGVPAIACLWWAA